jgi:hypothetical protein
MAEYQQLLAPDGTVSTTVLRVADNAHVPDDPANRDRQSYNQWVADGGVPDPPPPSPELPPPAPLPLEAHPEDPMDAATKAYVDTEVGKLRAQLMPVAPAAEA